MKEILWISDCAMLRVMFFLLQLCSASEPPIVYIDDGGLIGKYERTNNKGVRFAAFEGIPYAKPPVGELRFKRPQRNKPWGKTLDFSEDWRTSCSQQIPWEVEMDVLSREDCLRLHVFTPRLPNKTHPYPNLAVMVHIHAGGHSSRSGNKMVFGPNVLMEYDVIMVGVNYRLGPFGFMSFGSEEVSGNQMLFDQSLALEWVQENIWAFGGDPDKVTIFGVSSGALDATYHMYSPQSKGKFHRLIAMSGQGASPGWTVHTKKRGNNQGLQYIKQAGCKEVSIAMARQIKHKMNVPNEEYFDLEAHFVDICMRTADAKTLVTFTPMDTMELLPQLNQWQAILDYNITRDPFFPDEIDSMLKTGKFNTEVQVIQGYAMDDGMLLLGDFMIDPLLQGFYTMYWGQFFPIRGLGRATWEITEHDRKFAEKVWKRYIGDLLNFNPFHFFDIAAAFTDASVAYGVHKMSKYGARHNMSVYQYIFNYKGDFGYLNVAAGGDSAFPTIGVCHADDSIYVFDPVFGVGDLQLNQRDIEFRHLLVTYWTNFAKTGDPNSPSGSSLPHWDPVTPKRHKYMLLDEEPRMERSKKYKTRMRFWEKHFENPEGKDLQEADVWTLHDKSLNAFENISLRLAPFSGAAAGLIRGFVKEYFGSQNFRRTTSPPSE